MKKLLLSVALVMSGAFALNAQAPLLYQDFDATAVGSLPAGWSSTGGFKVYGSPHGWSVPNACSVEMSSTNTQDTLLMPSIGPIDANSKLSLTYRFVDAALYPNTGTQLQSGDKVVIDAYLGGTWYSSVATIDNTVHPTAMTTWTTYTYTNSLFSLISGQNIQLRLDAARASGDWFLDIDNIIVADVVTGITYNGVNPPSVAVAPNPASGSFWLWVKDFKGTESVKVNIYNNVGQIVKTVTDPGVQYTRQFNISTEGLARGVYMVEVQCGNDVSKTKLVVE